MVVEQAQIDAWKAQYGTIHELTVTVDETEKVTCYLKKANRNVVAYAASAIAQNKLLEAGEFILDNCWVGGDTRVKSLDERDEDVRMAAAQAAVGVVRMLTAELKKV